MKKLILLLLLALPLFALSQTGTGGNNTGGNNTGGNNNNPNTNNQNNTGGNANPFSTQPYQNSPYDNNPYFDQNQINNSGNKNQQNNNQQNNQNNQNTNNQNINNQNFPNLNDKNFQDLNSRNQDQMLQELYKNDPDYLKYLMANKQDLEVKIDTVNKSDSLKKKVYGSDFFNSNSFDLSDRTLSAPPLDYRLGTGDELIISLWNGGELQKNYTIAKDGSIFPQAIGKIYIQGMTLSEAQTAITNKFRKVVPNNTSIDVQLGKSRSIKVTIVGEVKRPGTYTISAFNNALNALFKSGGITDVGNLRRIEIIREGRVVDEIDLYKYLQNNTQAANMYLEDNDFIRVGVYERKVNADGEFKRPMFYQLKDDEGLVELIEFAGGPKFNARNSLLHIKTVINEEERYIDLDGKSYIDANGEDNYVLRDGDVVTLKPINEGLKNIVRVEGAVNYPDDYEVRDGERLSDVIKRAGGISASAYMPRAYIFRGSNTLESEAIKINISDLSKSDNVELYSGDKVKILSQKDFEQQYQIEVIGYVRKPGKIIYYKNITLKDALLLTGGLRLDAENGRIEISNIVDSVNNYNLDSKGANIRIVSINSNLEIDEASDRIVLKPMDRVYVRKKSEFLAEEKVTILGEVQYPGEYVLVEKNEKISSIIKRAGGVNKTAFTEGSKLNRSIVGPVVIDLPEALKKTGGKQDVILRDGDVIIIPQMNDIVSVRGEIQQPVNIKFDNENPSIGYYIGSAGGYGERPWKKRINVRYQNGRIKNTKNFLFLHFYPKVKPGSLVNVPKKPEKTEKAKFSEIFTYSLSAITTLATLLVLAKSLN